MDLLILFSEFEFSKFPCKKESKKELFGLSKKKIYSWSYNRGYIDFFYTRVLS
jgi:NAD(P)H-quinone oxidoreductase subunit 5